MTFSCARWLVRFFCSSPSLGGKRGGGPVILVLCLAVAFSSQRVFAQDEISPEPAPKPLFYLLHSGGLSLEISDPRLDPVFSAESEKGAEWAALFDSDQFAKLLARSVELIGNWNLAGPFHYNPDQALAQQQYPPEKGPIDLGARYVGSGGRRVGWQPVEGDEKGMIDVRLHLDPAEHMMTYALASIEAPREEQVILGIHSDDGVEAWLNGRKVHSNPAFRALNRDPDRVSVTLKPGKNELLLKVANNTGSWAFKAQILGGSPIYKPELHAKTLAFLAEAARARNFRPEADLDLIRNLFQHENASVRKEALRLSGVWKLEVLRPELAAIVSSAEISDRIREKAARALVDLGAEESAAYFRELNNADRPPRIRMTAIAGLMETSLEAAAEEAARLLSEERDGMEPGEIFALFLQRENGAEKLANALIAFDSLPPESARAGIRLMHLTGREVPVLLDRLYGVLEKRPNSLKPEDVEELRLEAASLGDAQQGERIFHQTGCMVCHKLAGAGGEIGPALDPFLRTSEIEGIIEALLEPDKEVRDGFAATRMVDAKGMVYLGIEAQKENGARVLRDPLHGEVPLPLASVREAAKLSGSLMSSGLVESLSLRQLAHLTRFLSDFSEADLIPEGKVARTWRVLDPVPAGWAEMKGKDLNSQVGRLDQLEWKTVYSTVSGLLPLDELASTRANSAAFLQCEIRVSPPGKVRLRLNSPKGLSGWLDGSPVRMKEEMMLDMPEGTRKFLIRVDLEKRQGTGIQFQIERVKGSPGGAQFLSKP
jgi:putative heme-binding domain-containing protein